MNKKGFMVLVEVIMTVLIILVILVTIAVFLPKAPGAAETFMTLSNKANYANKYGSSDMYYFDFPARHRIMQFFVDNECLGAIGGSLWDKDIKDSIADRKLNPKYAPYFPTLSSLEERWENKYILCLYEDRRSLPNTGPRYVDDNIGTYGDLARNCKDFFSDHELGDTLRFDDIADHSVVCMLLERPIIDSEGNGMESITGYWSARNLNFLKSEKGIMMLPITE